MIHPEPLVSLTPEFREHLEDKYYNERFEEARNQERRETELESEDPEPEEGDEDADD